MSPSNNGINPRPSPARPSRPQRPFSLAQGKEAFEAILARINKTENDVHNMDLSAIGRGERAREVSGAIKLDRGETKKLIDELAMLPLGLTEVILTRVLPERLKPARDGGIFLTKNAAASLNKAARERGLDVRFEARAPALPVAMPRPGPGPIGGNHPAPIEGVVPIDRIAASAPVDARVVARINEISSAVVAKEAGKGKNVLASVANIIDMIAPVSVSLLPSAGDSAAEAQLKKNSLKLMKKDFAAEHLSDQEFIHQLQVIHAQLLQYKGMITLGNEIVVDDGNRIRAEVGDAVKKAFGAEVRSLPMKRDPEGAARIMSDNIEKATTVYGPPAEGSQEPKKVKDGLKDVVKADFVRRLDAASVATLTALLDWRYVFDEAKTSEQDVKSADGSAQKKKLMTLETGYRVNPTSRDHENVPKLEVAESNGFVFVKLPYDDKVDRSGERHFGPPPTQIYRIVGAPSVGAQNRHQRLSRMLVDLPQNDPLKMEYDDRRGKVTMARVQAEGEADPFDLLAHAGIDARAWAFPLLEGDAVKFSVGIHKGAAEDTEKGTIVQFVTVGGMERTAMPVDPPFEVRTDVPYYNAIVVELKGARGEPVPLKIAEWTVEDFEKAKDPTSNR